MYLSCLQTSYSTGASSVVCKDIYNFYDCLYLDSAQWKLNNNIWSQITKGIVRDAIMTAMGYGLQLGFNKACAEYMYNPVSGVTIFTGWKSALCGAGSVLLKGRETLALLTTPGQVLKDLFKGNSVDDPAKVNDYCNGGALYAN